MINLLKKGFTLIELLVVIAIIGILTAVVTTNLVSARARARDSRRKSDLQSISQSLRLYYSDHQGFPAAVGGVIQGCSPSCPWGSAFKSATTTYMGYLPFDPSNTATNQVTYSYYSSANGNSYTLVTQLENLSDTDISDSQLRCANSLNGHVIAEPTKEYIVCGD